MVEPQAVISGPKSTDVPNPSDSINTAESNRWSMWSAITNLTR